VPLDAATLEALRRAEEIRRSEALFINARELVKQGLWTIPEEHMKNGFAFLLPLPPAAIAILEEVGADKETGFYFISSRTGQPYEPRSIDHACRDLFLPRKRKLKRGVEKPPAPPHCRRKGGRANPECG
jgi:integrase